jgi:hypothetical protein
VWHSLYIHLHDLVTYSSSQCSDWPLACTVSTASVPCRITDFLIFHLSTLVLRLLCRGTASQCGANRLPSLCFSSYIRGATMFKERAHNLTFCPSAAATMYIVVGDLQM